MRLRRFAAALLWTAAPLLAGCFQSSTLVKLNPDGSGTVERTTTIRTGPYAQVLAGDEETGADDSFSADLARAAAGAMGSGVTFVSAARIDTPARKGITAVYAFKDIRTLSLGLMMPPDGVDAGVEPDTPIGFAFTRLPNGHSLLTIENDIDALYDVRTPRNVGPATPPSRGVDDTRETDTMNAALAGLKVDFAIQVDRLIKTNTPYVSGGRVTLLSVDFDQLVANAAAFEKVQKAGSLTAAKTALRSVKGIKASLDPELTIEFGK